MSHKQAKRARAITRNNNMGETYREREYRVVNPAGKRAKGPCVGTLELVPTCARYFYKVTKATLRRTRARAHVHATSARAARTRTELETFVVETYEAAERATQHKMRKVGYFGRRGS